MAVQWPGFAERVFEFSVNAEYANLNKAILAGTPHLPTQNEEKYLGYDVAFAIQAAGGVVNTVALQHKTCRRVDISAGTNAHFCKAAGTPYFAFRIDVEQFNAIEQIASAGMSGVEVYYCAPLFTTQADMDVHYIGQTVLASSVWIDVSGIGPLDPAECHSIVYAGSGTSAWVFSKEPKKLRVAKPRRARKEGPRKRLGDDILRKNYEIVFRAVHDRLSGREMKRLAIAEDGPRTVALTAPKEMEPVSNDVSEIRATRDLITSFLGMSVLVETVKDPSG